MRLAAIQMTSGTDVAMNLAAARAAVADAAAAGARLVVLPENVALMPAAMRDVLTIVERDGDGPIQQALSSMARDHRVWLVGGTVPLQAGERASASCLVFDDRGERVARYDKIHLFDVEVAEGERYQESSVFAPGDTPVVVETPAGRLGLAVCYDLRFPELFRRLLDQGAEIFAVPAAFTARTGRAHWEVLVRARAIENLATVVAAAQWGEHANGRATWGDSLIANPWGEVLARCETGTGVVTAVHDRAQQQKTRTQFPSIHHRRFRA